MEVDQALQILSEQLENTLDLATCLDEVFPQILEEVMFPREACKVVPRVNATLQ
jgi:hypothetical protein